MKIMSIATLLIITILNINCADTSSKSKEISLLEESTDRKAEVVNETMEIEEASANRDLIEPADNYEVTEKPEDKGSDEQPRVQEKTPLAETYDKEKTYEKQVDSDLEEEVLIGDLNADEDRVKETVKEEEKEVDEEPAETGEVGAPDHTTFNDLLAKHVSTKGAVDYAGIKGDLSELDAYLETLSNNPVEGSWSRNEKLAYWINAYNAFTIKLILDNYPVSSIQDIANGKPWDKKWIKLGGETYSLNQIENDIIRPQFNEPRIHFAVNCAAQSCPPLANQAYTPGNLNSLLERQTKAFVNNTKYNKIGENSVKISKIFDWYGVDFGDKIAFLNKYSNQEISSDAEISYTEYDWALNN